jgi:hypothetical protein
VKDQSLSSASTKVPPPGTLSAPGPDDGPVSWVDYQNHGGMGVAQGDCLLKPIDTDGLSAKVELFGRRPDGSFFSLGNQQYNSSVSGLGIGTEGSWSAGPYVWIW